MFNHRVDVDELSPVKKEEPKSNAFSRLPNLGGAGQSWLSSMASKQPEDGKMNRLVNRLREISKQNKRTNKESVQQMNEDGENDQLAIPQVSSNDKQTQEKLKQQKKPFTIYK
jgi:hypothetical protein